MYKPSESWSHDFIPCYKKGFEGTTSWRGFWLSLACWATNTTDIIFNTLTELREILLSDGSSWKKVQRKQQSSVSTQRKLVGLEDRHCTAVWWNKRCKPLAETLESKKERFISVEIYTEWPWLNRTCGLYEWRAIRRQDQPDRVVYVRSTCTRFDNDYYELLRSRILGPIACTVIIKQLW